MQIQRQTAKRLCVLGMLFILPVLVGCSAAQTPQATPAAGTAIAQAPQTSTNAGNYVLIYQLYGTPTMTPTPNPTDVAIWATINAGTPTDEPTSAQSATPASSVAGAVGTASADGSMAMNMGGTSPTVPGDPKAGNALFHGAAGCSACHDTNSTTTIVGPGMKGLAGRAGNRVPGKSADDYLHESILKPNAFVVPGFSANIMPQTFGETLSPQQINNIVAYLKTLK